MKVAWCRKPGDTTRSQPLLVVGMLGETHASEIADILGRSVSRIQAGLGSLELAGLVVRMEEGRARRVRLNPRFPAKDELQALGVADRQPIEFGSIEQWCLAEREPVKHQVFHQRYVQLKEWPE